jgi:hypothetical protein
MQAVIKENCSTTMAEKLFRTFLFYYGECNNSGRLLGGLPPLPVQRQLFSGLVRAWRSTRLPFTDLEQSLLAATTANKVLYRFL